MIGKNAPGTILPIIFAPINIPIIIASLGGAYMIGKVAPGTILPIIFAPIIYQS